MKFTGDQLQEFENSFGRPDTSRRFVRPHSDDLKSLKLTPDLYAILDAKLTPDEVAYLETQIELIIAQAKMQAQRGRVRA